MMTEIVEMRNYIADFIATSITTLIYLTFAVIITYTILYILAYCFIAFLELKYYLEDKLDEYKIKSHRAK